MNPRQASAAHAPAPAPEDGAAPAAGGARNRRRTLVVFVLAAVSLGGIGAGVTTAAWTDNGFFSGQAEAAVFSLKGSVDGTTFVSSNDADQISLTIPAQELANLLPGQTRTIDLWVANEGSVNAALTSSAGFVSSTFATDPTVALVDLAATLTPVSTSGSVDKFQLTVVTPLTWSVLNQNESGQIVVTITGTATA